MNTTLDEAVKLAGDMVAGLQGVKGVEKLVCPPFVSLAAVSTVLKGTSVNVGAQNMYQAEKGAYTGEVSPLMLAGLCRYVILGHSERRQYFGETDELVNQKVGAALRHSLKPIMCVGEKLAENESGNTESVITRQVRSGLVGIAPNENLVIAYEPVWAIGTGKAATAAEAEVTCKLIRGLIGELWGTYAAEGLRILYGGSVNVTNASEFVREPDIDGGLVGGASLNAAEFVNIANQTANARVKTP